MLDAADLVLDNLDKSNLLFTQARELHYRRRYPNRRKSDLTLFLVYEDEEDDTFDCVERIEDENYQCVNVEITDTDDDADWGDLVYYFYEDSDCDDALDDIEDNLGCYSGYRRYERKDGRGFRRYRFYRNSWW
jgi:hypothetical protein